MSFRRLAKKSPKAAGEHGQFPFTPLDFLAKIRIDLGGAKPLYLIERTFAEQLEFDDEARTQVAQVNEDLGLEWLFSFLSADKRKTYCLYQAPNPELIREAARRVGAPVDAIIEVSELRPELPA